jgi:AcrR family transcriptional regulator
VTDKGQGAAGGDLGLRERKKRQTREAIALAAGRLFAQRGFDAVTVGEIAHAADVSRQTIFNYFSNKEEMLFDRDAEILQALLDGLSERPTGSSPVAVFRAHTRAFWAGIELVARGGPGVHGFWGIVRSSSALRAHAEVMFARQADAIALALAAEQGAPDDDPSCHALARMLCGVNAAVLTCGLERITSGGDPRGVASDMIRAADAAYDLLEGVSMSPGG